MGRAFKLALILYYNCFGGWFKQSKGIFLLNWNKHKCRHNICGNMMSLSFKTTHTSEAPSISRGELERVVLRFGGGKGKMNGPLLFWSF